MTDSAGPSRGVVALPSDEEMRAFRRVSTEDELRWLGELHELLSKVLPPDRVERMNRFRAGEL